MDLIAKAKAGTLWMALQEVSFRVLSFGTNIILARLLFPRDFGVVALALVAWEIIRLLGNLGIGAKLIHQQDDIEGYATAAFWLNITLAIILAVLTAIIAPYIALFYSNDLIHHILLLYSAVYIIQSLGSTHLALLNKALAFKKIALVELLITFLSKSIAITMAITGYGVWSLVIPEVILSPLKVLGLWIINPWRPSLALNISYWRDIFVFGFNFLGADLVRYLNINGDYMIIGKLLGEHSLGLYTFAYNLANLPFQAITAVAAKVAFPILSGLQDNLERFREVFLKMTKVVSLVSFPLLIELFIFSDLFVPLIYGNKWEASILPLKIIIGFVLFRTFASPGGQILFAMGRPDILFKFNLGQVPFLLTAVFIGARYGIVGAAIGMSGVLMVGTLVLLYISLRPIGLSLRTPFQAIFPAAASSGLTALSLGLLKGIFLTAGLQNYLILISLMPLGFVIYLIALSLFFRDDFKFLRNLFWEELIGRAITTFRSPDFASFPVGSALLLRKTKKL
ncbi:MAG: hypothetical protein A3G93_16505 [Nitrospinae bacterium RIFCSPLOWO2_12_FULL_45_22]|nr:MAG: hypothetical protein A3G93_16505 [Nitrospinae bacterium RIFCSPLOWO2_12_FULL_45_22]